MLSELPALLALGAPGVASYLRLVPSQWAGAYHCWGLENREAALRLIAGRSPNAEIKCFDGAATPSLASGGVIAAGLAGIERGAALPEEVHGDPARSDDPPPRLPRSLAESLSAFERSDVLREALGDVLHEAVRAVRQGEIDLFAGRSPEEITAATRWRY